MMQRDLPPDPVSGEGMAAAVSMPDAAAPLPIRDTHRGRLFRKYLLLILSLVTTVLLVSSGINLYFSYQENRAALASLQREKAIGAASRIEQYIRQVSQQLGYASLPQLDASDVEARRIEFLKLLRQAPEVTDIAQLDASGREQLAVSRLGMDIVASAKDRSLEPAFQKVRRGQPWYGPVYFRKETEPYMTVAIRSGGDALGNRGPVTVAEVNLKFIWEVVSRIKIGAKGKAYVIDSTGLLVADPDIGLVLRKTSLADLAHVKAAVVLDAEDETAMVSKDLAGTPVLTSVAPIEALDWKVFVEQPIAEVYAKLNASILRTGALLLAGLVISALAASVLARSMVRPIRTLDEGARRIGAGELDQRIAIKTGDELEGLADQFNRMTARLRESYAGLERKVEQRTGELTESLEYQTAISDVLRVISESPTDVTPVFEAIMDSARRLFASPMSAVFRFDGRLLHLAAHRNWSAEGIEDARRMYPGPPDPGMLSGRVILTGQAQTIVDTQADPTYPQATARAGKWRRMIGAPMLKDGVPLGVVVVAWPDPGETPRRQADLLKTFADQAVIAIENVRLINETKEALERQTATAEILRVISGSPTNVQPVLDAVAERSGLLCRAEGSRVWLLDGEHLRAMTSYGPSYGADPVAELLPLQRSSVGGRAFLERRCVHVDDIVPLIDTEYPDVRELQARYGFRTVLAVPMLREGVSVGVISLLRNAVRPFTPSEINLIQTFADQAVIAIENVRLFSETREALDRQTATSEILQVISSSVSDTAPVFEKILDSCQHLFATEQLGIFVTRGDAMLHAAAWRGAAVQAVVNTFPKPLEQTATAIAIRERRTLNFDSAVALADVPKSVSEIAALIGDCSIAWAPMLWEDRGVGSICVLRQPPKPFDADELALLKTFADQAVIAIQNARLFNETKEALEQQTATSEVLQVISGSMADAQPVFEKILRSCQRLFASDELGTVLIGDGGQLRLGASLGPGGARHEREFTRPVAGSATELAIDARRVLHYPDVSTDPDVPATLRQMCERMGIRSMLMSPMLWEDRGIGSIWVARTQPKPYTDKDVTLLKTFADQAVIAIQNARLFHEIEDKSRQLEVANRHKSEFLANMSHELRTPLNAIIGFSEVLTEQMFGEVNDKQMEYLHDIHSSGQHLLTLINDVLDLSKIEAGRMDLELSCFDLGLLLDNSMTLVRERAQRQGLALSLEVGDGLEEWVADARKVKQVVVNLLSNAVKFTPTGGRVTLRARRADVGEVAMAEVSVVDTGVGIAPAEQELVFQEFRQASGDYLRKTEGTGLGLSLAKRFAELHGGTIRIDSERGQGATFTVTLPLLVLEAI